MRISTVITLALILAAAGCSQAPVITLTNQSSQTVSNVVVSGAGFSEQIDSIPAGAQHELAIHPTGESGLRVAFDAGTQHVDSGEQGYSESGGGYRVSAIISTNLDVSVSSDLRTY